MLKCQVGSNYISIKRINNISYTALDVKEKQSVTSLRLKLRSYSVVTGVL